jgi:hypothetical protein
MKYDATISQLREQLDKRKNEWWLWHQANPLIWEKFEEYTREAIMAGKKSYSHWAIVNRIRWHCEVETKGGTFKISNNHIAFYARLFHAYHPNHAGFFNVKPFKEESMIEELSQRNVIYLEQRNVH